MSQKAKSGKAKKKKTFRPKRFFKISFVYFMLFTALLGMVDYYAWMEFNFLWFIALAAILAMAIGYYHVRYGTRDHVDDIADEFL
jgi:putative Mn2+ efflux pump MntP